MRRVKLQFLAYLSVLFLSLQTLVLNAQTLPPGIINVPGTYPFIENVQSIGSDTTLNLYSGGSIGTLFEAGVPTQANENVEVNVLGGNVGCGFEAHSGSTVNISGGSIENGFTAYPGSEVNISGGATARNFEAKFGSTIYLSGGSVGHYFETQNGSDVNIVGNEFLLNGVPTTDPRITLQESDILTGTLVDGSPFLFSPLVGDQLNGVSLIPASLPSIDPNHIFVDDEVNLYGLRSGQTLTLIEGGVLGKNFSAVGATLNISGGTVESLEVANSQLNIDGGTVADWTLYAFSGSNVNISGGTVTNGFEAHEGTTFNVSGGNAGSFRAYTGSVVNISGGVVGVNSIANADTVINVSGGTVGDRFRAFSDSIVNVSGGHIGDRFMALDGSVVNISGGTFGDDIWINKDTSLFGGEFLLNGSPIGTSTITLSSPDVLTGTLEDGSPFLFSLATSDTLNEVRLVATSVPPLDVTPIVVDSDIAPSGLRAGQSLTLKDGGVIRENFAAVSADVNIEGGQVEGIEVVSSSVSISSGTIGDGFTVLLNSNLNISGGSIGRGMLVGSGTTTNISGGTIGGDFSTGSGTVNISGGSIGNFIRFYGGEINISGGSLGNDIEAYQGSVVTITGGDINRDFTAGRRSEVNISGGNAGTRFEADALSVVNISGGLVSDAFNSHADSTINLHGGEFLLNGEVIVETEVTLSDADVLSGTYESGAPFLFSIDAFDRIRGSITLFNTPLPALDSTPIIVDSENPLSGLRSGQSLILRPAGRLLEKFTAVGATLHITGGEANYLELADSKLYLTGGNVHQGIVALLGTEISIYGGSVTHSIRTHSGSQVNIFGGSVGDRFVAGGEVNISGGIVGEFFAANSGSIVNITGGAVGDEFDARDGSVVNISGGTVGDEFDAHSGSIVNITAGTVGNNFWSFPGTEVVISGGEFLLNGEEYTRSTITLSRDDVLTGTLEDGSPFIFSDQARDKLLNAKLISSSIPANDASHVSIDSPSTLNGLRAGQSLSLVDGGVLPKNFAAVGAVVDIAGGTAEDLEVADSIVNISRGTLKNGFNALLDSIVNVSGGTIDGNAQAFSGSTVNLYGSGFRLAGELLEDLRVADATTIHERNVTLSGKLVDGSLFSFWLGGRAGGALDFFAADATLTVTLVPEPKLGQLLTLLLLLLLNGRFGVLKQL